MMRAVAGAIFLTATATALLMNLGLAGATRRVLALTRSAAAVVADAALDDDAKGAALRHSSVQLAGLFLMITGVLAGSVAAPLAVLWLLDRNRILSLAAVLEVLASPPFIIAASLALLAVWLLLARRRR